jgi:hypothetical protein
VHVDVAILEDTGGHALPLPRDLLYCPVGVHTQGRHGRVAVHKVLVPLNRVESASKVILGESHPPGYRLDSRRTGGSGCAAPSGLAHLRRASR